MSIATKNQERLAGIIAEIVTALGIDVGDCNLGPGPDICALGDEAVAASKYRPSSTPSGRAEELITQLEAEIVKRDALIADLEAQLEHLGGLVILITTSRQLIRQIRKRIVKGYIVFAKNMDEAVEIANGLAPEHLQILTNNPLSVAKKIKNAGAIFLGPYSPTAVGDYVAGPSHVLPTLGTAKFFSGLCLSDFTKRSHIISYSRKALEKIQEPLKKVATIEGLHKHYESVKIRF